LLPDAALLHLEACKMDDTPTQITLAVQSTQTSAPCPLCAYWVWTAMDAQSKLLVVVDVDSRTLAMAQRVVHQVTQVLAPGCVLLSLTDGLKDYGTALLTHFGYWMQPERRQDKGPRPKPRWMPLPELLYAQVVKSYRRWRIVGVKHPVVFGTRLAIEQILAKCGWTINTAAYLGPADKYYGPVLSRLRGDRQSVSHTQSGFSTPHSILLASI